MRLGGADTGHFHRSLVPFARVGRLIWAIRSKRTTTCIRMLGSGRPSVGAMRKPLPCSFSSKDQRMISPETILYVYELHGDLNHDLPFPPASFIGLWNEEEFSYLFFTAPEDEYIKGVVDSGRVLFESRHEMKYEDWQVGLPADGLQLGGIHFVPRDHPYPPPGAIVLDPSVVFGDGTHPTTAASLSFMQHIVHSHHIESMLDLGTGTGILALAAVAMGVTRVVAVDKNKLAVRTARENVEANSAASVITIHEGEARLFIDEPFDLVAANLPFQVLRDLVTLNGADVV